MNLQTETRTDWILRAACRGRTELFWSNDMPEINQAIEICRRCPVFEDCDDYAAELRPTSGVWAGRLMAPPNADSIIVCRLCGRYAIDRKRGRPRMYCSPECASRAWKAINWNKGTRGALTADAVSEGIWT